MKRFLLFTALLLLLVLTFGLIRATNNKLRSERMKSDLVDTRVDNIGYWVKAAERGLVPFNQEVEVEAAVFTGSDIAAYSVLTDNSPDIPVTESNTYQSENSVFADPNNPNVLLNSNNSSHNPSGGLYGASNFYSFDASDNWEGDYQGTGGDNKGDPSAVIDLNGRWYINYINNSEGQSCSYSDDQGATWTTVSVAFTGGLADKNHICVDNNPTSPNEGNVYIAWNNIGGEYDSEIGFAYSHDHGESWTSNLNISGAISSSTLNQGVNISTGPNGEVYVVWAIYDEWPGDETALGFAKSLDGGVNWEPAERIITNIRGIRSSRTSKNMRVNSFPSATVDNSDRDYNGTIYVTWANIGIPGENTGDDIDVYLIKSVDGGDNWTHPIRINQDAMGQGHEHYFPWIVCDEANGILSAVFYDDRNVGGDKIEVYCANSLDGGETWQDFKVSDVATTPAPIAGLANNYFGDYIGITAQDGWVYPTWTDNRSGSAMTYVSPYQTNPLNRPHNLSTQLTFASGAVDLNWSYVEGLNFTHFVIYRDGSMISTLNDTTYTDTLPDYGIHKYKVTAAYSVGGESGGARRALQWGDAQIHVSPLSVSERLTPDGISTKFIELENIGQLDLSYSIPKFNYDSTWSDYCYGGGGGHEYISRVVVGDIDNVSGDSSYADYTNLLVEMQVGKSYPITVHNGNPQEYDRATCFIDWNGNNEFDEEVLVLSGSFTDGPYSGEILPPAYAKPGLTRMRVRLSYGGGFEPCGYESFGEVEDYSIDVKNWLSIDPVNGVVAPGNAEMIAVNYDANDIELGTYTTSLQFTSNDPDTILIEVHISLRISQMIVTINADQDGVCPGENTQLLTTLAGSGNELTYSWSSNPEGFTAATSDVIVQPNEPTWYYVTVSNANLQTTVDSVFIDVYSLPFVDLGEDKSVCYMSDLTLDAGNPGSTYLWSTGDTTQSIDVVANDLNGTTYSVTVTNESLCMNFDSISTDVHPLSMVDLGADTSICDTESWTLDAGNPGSTYLWSTGDTTQMIQVYAEQTGEESYSVEITDVNSCVSFDEIVIDWIVCTGTNETDGFQDLYLFPNPTHGIINLQSEVFKTHTAMIEVLGLDGTKLMEQLIPAGAETHRLDATQLKSGVYLCRLTMDGSGITKMIVVY
jgi:hypothetical protein